MKHDHNLLQAVLMAILVICSTQIALANSYDFKSDNIFYSITGDNTVSVTSGTNVYYGDVVIPASVTYQGVTYQVTGIDEWTFMECAYMYSVELPSTLTSIGEYAFRNCFRLVTINLPNSITSIGPDAFSNCYSLTSINIPTSLQRIEEATFSNCSSLTSLTIPDGVTYIGDYAFSYCDGLATVNFGNSVAIIGNGAFAVCDGLTHIAFPESVHTINEYAFDNCAQLAEITFPTSITSIGIGAFDNTPWYYSQQDGLLNIGELLYKYKGEMPCGTQLELQDGIHGIAGGAFEGCKGLASISIPKSVNRINPHAFTACDSLTKVVCMGLTPPQLDNSDCFDSECYSHAKLLMPHIAVEAYQASEYWQLFADIEGIDYAFQSSNNNYLMTSDSTVTFIYKEENYYDYTGDVVIPATVTFGDQVFKVTAIGDGALEGCEYMTSVTIPTTVLSIGNNAFDACCGLTEVVIPESVISIGSQAFQGCTGLTDLTIGSGVSTIGAKAFYYCNALTNVTCEALTPPVMESYNCFTLTCYSNATLNVPNDVINQYETADYWYRFTTIKGMVDIILGDVNGDGVVSIKDATLFIDYLLGGETIGTFHTENADMDGNGEITIKDMTLLIDALLSGIYN